MNPPTKALIEVIGAAGFNVQVGMANGLHAVEAVDRRTWETFVVRGDGSQCKTVDARMDAQVNSAIRKEQKVRASRHNLCAPMAKSSPHRGTENSGSAIHGCPYSFRATGPIAVSWR